MKSCQVAGRNLRRGLSRGDFLKVGGFGVVGAALLGGFITAEGAEAKSSMISARELGIAPGNDGVTNRENLVKALRYTKRNVVFPKGDYVIDNSDAAPNRGLNSNGHINIDLFEGEMVMEEGARLVFTNKKRRGLVFYGGSGMTLRGLKTTFRDMPQTRIIPEECIYIQRTTDTVVDGARIDGSASAGFVLWECIRPVIKRTMITNTMADGIHFVNCQSPRAESIRTRNTGDDALAFNNYVEWKPYTGGYANDIHIEDSKARGIMIGGQSDVLVENFSVDGTNASGVIVGYDAYWKTRSPNNVTLRDGEIRNAGKVVDPAGKTGNKYGLEIDAVGKTTVEDVKIISPAGRGVSGVISRKVQGKKTVGPVNLTNISVSNSPDEGFSLYGVAHDAPLDSVSGSGAYNLDNLSATNTGKAGMAILRADRVNFNRLVATETSRRDSLRRAIWFMENRAIDGTGLHIVDTKSNPTGYKVSTYRDKGMRLGKIYDRVAKRKLILENKSKLQCQIV